jgi:hypothetical protein
VSLDKEIECIRACAQQEIDSLEVFRPFPGAFEALLDYVIDFDQCEDPLEYILHTLMVEDQGDGVLRFEIDYEHYHWDASTLKWVCEEEEEEEDDE